VCLTTAGERRRVRGLALVLPAFLCVVRRAIEAHLLDTSLGAFLHSVVRPLLLTTVGALVALGMEHSVECVWTARMRCEGVERENGKLMEKLSHEKLLLNQLHSAKGFADEVALAVANNTLTLPMHLTRLLEASESWPPPSSVPQPSAPGLRLLIVDDMRVNLLVLERFIKKLLVAPVVHKATDSSRALEWLLQVPRAIDLALLDEDLGPDSAKGTDITRRVREFEAAHALPSMPIVGVTAAAGMPGLDEMAIAAGQDLVLGKPLPPTVRPVLLDLIKRS